MTPGYGDEVIFADGTFIDGSTAELSADGPIRPPYVVYCQVLLHCSKHCCCSAVVLLYGIPCAARGDCARWLPVRWAAVLVVVLVR